ncbi:MULTISPECIES: WecB/TagA/CpsF family glycosyltransferase [unclassified Mycobacterium]|uniref:WecB/TagA/CpsF family glycosyltransferase n=1 Tax=unclassified Mycobacterium TaxID=2642494 RepID=UPI00099225C1|nr:MULTISPECIES: WecB/TagA/CpsF family glycosyltransferase [unclassified Mycobacterium]
MSTEALDSPVRVTISQVTVDLCSVRDVLAAVAQRAAARADRPLVVGSVNLDHLHHFGAGRANPDCAELGPRLDWLMLADGAPIVARARLKTRRNWPRITGADLLPLVLEQARRTGKRVGFLGGLPQTHDRLRAVLDERYPGLDIAGWWAPDRCDLTDPGRSDDLARDIAAAGADVLVVGLGKPLQELWIARHGVTTGAVILLAFGASADFLAGAVTRAPEWMQRCGLEWSYRLGREPRRMARRYLVQGPASVLRLRRASVEPARSWHAS